MLLPLRLKVAALPKSPPIINRPLIQAHTSVDGTDLDYLTDFYMAAAVEWAEGYMHRTIISRAHEWTLYDFPQNGRQEIHLPRGKTQSVEQVVYARNGSTTTLTGPSSATPGTDYQENLDGDDGGFLMPPRGADWPSTDDDVPAPVVVHFTAGWAAADVPSQIRHAVALYIADAIENRGDAETDGSMLMMRQQLLSPWCLRRLY